MRIYTENKYIIRPKATRFATSFLTLVFYRSYSYGIFFLIDEYAELMQTSKKNWKKFAHRARMMADVVISNRVWKSVALATKFSYH
jgi:hypothetical protein